MRFALKKTVERSSSIVFTVLRFTANQRPEAVRRWRMAVAAGRPGLTVAFRRAARRVSRVMRVESRGRTAVATSADVNDGVERVTTRQRVPISAWRERKEKSPLLLTRAVATAANGETNGNVACSSATVMPAMPAPSTWPETMTPSLQSARSSDTRAVTPVGPRRVRTLEIVLRFVPAAFVATTCQ